MASSSEAFEKFSQWKTLKTWLNVTVIERGKPEDVFPGVYVFGVDKEASQVGIVQPSTRGHAAFDVGKRNSLLRTEEWLFLVTT